MSCQYRLSLLTFSIPLAVALTSGLARAQLADAGAPVEAQPTPEAPATSGLPAPAAPPPVIAPPLPAPTEVVPQPAPSKPTAPALTTAPPASPQAASSVPAPPATQLVSMGPKGLTVQSPDAKFSFNLRFPFMFDAKATLNDAQPKGGDAMFPRFFGPIFTVSLYKIVTGKLIVGFSDATAPAVNVVTAWADIGPLPLLHLRVGKLLYPISLERQTLPLRIVLLEHGIASGLLPLTEFGAQLWGTSENKVFEYQLTLGNGTPTGARSETDLDDGKDGIGRVYVRPFAATQNAGLKGLGIGFGGSYGRRQGSPTVPLTGTLRTLGGRPYFATNSDPANPATGTVFAKGNVVRLVPQLAYTGGPVSFYGEYIRLTEQLNKGSERRTLTHQSAHGVLAVVLTGEDAVLLDIVSPKRPFSLSRGQFGAFELAAHAEYVKFDEDTFPTFANPARSAESASAYGGGVNWIVNDLIRVMVDYEHTAFTAPAGAKKLKAENLLGARVQALF
ncbi:MAG: hypothetical protein ABW252_05145 [Polyangiales bacterium]